MRDRRKQLIMTVLIALGLVAAGCETTAGSAGLGAALGGAAGAIIGHQSGHTWEGAAIGAAVGGLAGYGIKKLKDRQTKTAQQTQQEYKYEPAQGLKLDVKNGTVSPAAVKPGDTVVASLEYAALGTGADGVNVKETRVLSKGEQQLGKMSDDTVRRTDGTWESSIEFKVPDNAGPGQYKLAQGVSAKDQSIERVMMFDVQQKTAKNEPAKRVVLMASTVK